MRMLIWLLLAAALGGPAGPYQVEVTTDPAVVPVGKARLLLRVTQGGKPVEGAKVTTFTAMPGMSMGEREETARPLAGQPGFYEAPAAFPMGGAYKIDVSVSGPAGSGKTTLQVSTGASTGAAGGLPWGWLMGGVLALLAVGLVAWRMRATGQTIPWRGWFSRPVLGGVILLAVMVGLSVYAIRTFRRPGAMTPIEAQVMEMNMPAPEGTTPVELAAVRRGEVAEVVRYTGQAVALEEQPVYARTTGVIEWMPFYQGDRVVRGQTLARLDVTQLEPRLAESRATAHEAQQSSYSAEGEYLQSRAQLDTARAEVGQFQAGLTAARGRVSEVEAEVRAADADALAWRRRLERSRLLAQQDALSREEFERERADAAEAESKSGEARARLAQARAQVDAARSELMSHHAHVREAAAGMETRRRQVGEAQARASSARARSEAASAELQYATITSSLDGVITQRLMSPGVLVEPGQAVLRVARVDPIRLQANVAQSDLIRLNAGNRVRARDPRGNWVEGRITSVRPALDPSDRLGMIEAVVRNPQRAFLPGAYVVLDLTVREARGALYVPSSAVQTASASSEGVLPVTSSRFVWVADPTANNQFQVRRQAVKTGASDGQKTAILEGLESDQQVVTAGFEYLREGQAVAPVRPVAAPQAQAEKNLQTVSIEASGTGFKPDHVELKAGLPARLTFTRVTDQTCATEVIFPELKITKELPLNKPVTIEFTPPQAATLNFTCGMDMLRGKLVVK